VNRRARRAKTDRLDVGKLLALLLRWLGGERKVWSVIHIPSAEAEAQRQLTREIDTVREDRKRARNRIQGGLATQGVRLPLTKGVVEQLATAQTGDGQPLSVAFRTRLEHEWAHLEAIEVRLDALTVARDEHIATGTDRVASVARQLCTLRAVAQTSAAVFSAELFGTRTFNNGRQLGALLGLVPVPYRSDQAVRDQGISKAGRAELRRMWLQIAWGAALATEQRIDPVVSAAVRRRGLTQQAHRHRGGGAEAGYCALAVCGTRGHPAGGPAEGVTNVPRHRARALTGASRSRCFRVPLRGTVR
jgi:transposase